MRQAELPFRLRGGRRNGAGRKPNGARAGVSHRQRAGHAASEPLHVTVRLAQGLPSLRTHEADVALRACFAKASDRFGFRLVHYSLQDDHVHMICEAHDREALSRGMQGLLIRVARALNKLWQRAGRVFADRFHAHVLATPREVRNAIAYVLHNARKHGKHPRKAFDSFCSGPWFDGWSENVRITGLEGIARPVATARTWLLRSGWRKHGLISVAEVPGPK